MEKQLSFRTTQLLEQLATHASRTRFILLVLSIFCIFLAVGVVNEQFGDTRTRMEVRRWTSSVTAEGEPPKPTIVCPSALSLYDRFFDAGGSPFPVTATPDEISCYDLALVRGDIDSMKILYSVQMSELEVFKLPLIGIAMTSGDSEFFGTLALFVILIWYWNAIKKEHSALARLVYPLVAEPCDREAELLWGFARRRRDPEALKVTIADLAEETADIKEVIGGHFLTVGSRKDRFAFVRYALARPLVIAPVIILGYTIYRDWWWNFEHVWPESGLTYSSEIGRHAEVLSKLARDARQSDPVVAQKLAAAADEMRSRHGELWLQFGVSLTLAVANVGLLVGIWPNIGRLEAWVQALYGPPEVLEGMKKEIREALDLP